MNRCITIYLLVFCIFISLCYADKGTFENYCQVPQKTATGVSWKQVKWWMVLKDAGPISNKLKYALFYNDGSKTVIETSNSDHHGVGFKDFIETVSLKNCGADGKYYFQSWFHEGSHIKEKTDNFDKPKFSQGFSKAHAKYLISHDAQFNGFIMDHSLPIPHDDGVFGKSTSTNPSQHAFCFNFNGADFDMIVKLFQVSMPMIVKTNGDDKVCKKNSSPLWFNYNAKDNLPKPFPPERHLIYKFNQNCKIAMEVRAKTIVKQKGDVPKRLPFLEVMESDYPEDCYKTLTFLNGIKAYGFDHNCFTSSKSTFPITKTTTPAGNTVEESEDYYSWRNNFYNEKCTENVKQKDYNRKDTHLCSPVEFGIDSWLAVSQLEKKLFLVSTQNQNHKLPSFIKTSDKMEWGVVDINSFFDTTNRHEKVGVEYGQGTRVCIGDSNRVQGQLHHLGNIFCLDDKDLANALRTMIYTEKKTVKKRFNTINLYSTNPNFKFLDSDFTIMDQKTNPDPSPPISTATGSDASSSGTKKSSSSDSRYPSFFYPNAEVDPIDVQILSDEAKYPDCSLYKLNPTEVKNYLTESKISKELNVRTDYCKPLFETVVNEHFQKVTIKDIYSKLRGFKQNDEDPTILEEDEKTTASLKNKYKSKEEGGGERGGYNRYNPRFLRKYLNCWAETTYPDSFENAYDFKISEVEDVFLERIEQVMMNPIPDYYTESCYYTDIIDLTFGKAAITTKECDAQPPRCPPPVPPKVNNKKRGRTETTGENEGPQSKKPKGPSKNRRAHSPATTSQTHPSAEKTEFFDPSKPKVSFEEATTTKCREYRPLDSLTDPSTSSSAPSSSAASSSMVLS
ncbi:hypothetical protein CYY_009058 [Polysphondylium violaceum]|uniref:Uncharacterized protein n=1 Tax=Polysphondylium violaceum TaxID=133409 RepID=A0A8J4PM65_9MYCE|nr:hypothetical protein CYY_009058 [Polysphondylium violaceum]